MITKVLSKGGEGNIAILSIVENTIKVQFLLLTAYQYPKGKSAMMRSWEDNFGSFIGLYQHALDVMAHSLQQQQYL